MISLDVRRLDERAKLPLRAYADDAGLDICALEAAELGPGERTSVRTGIALEVPPGHAVLVMPRSGLAARHGIALVNSPGLIDSGYRGEVLVLLLNTDRQQPARIEAGERIAQLVPLRLEAAEIREVERLSASQRGAGGFGSSGS